MPGPQATVTAHPDTYSTANGKTPVATPPVNTYTKQINAGDAKPGPRKGGSGQTNPDTFSE